LMMQAQSKFHEVRLSAQNHLKRRRDKMKLDVEILDQLIEEELQALLEQGTISVPRGRDRRITPRRRGGRAQKRTGRSYHQQRSAQEKEAASRPRRPIPKTSAEQWKRLNTAPEITAAEAEKADYERGGGRLLSQAELDRRKQMDLPSARGDQWVHDELEGRVGAAPVIGGLQTAQAAWQDPRATGLEKAVRIGAAGVGEIAGLNPFWTGITGGMTAAAGEDPIDVAIKKGFRGLPGAWKDPEKHKAQQKQAKAAETGTDVGGGMTQAQLDARNKERLAARNIGGPASAEDITKQQEFSAKQRKKLGASRAAADKAPLGTIRRYAGDKAAEASRAATAQGAYRLATTPKDADPWTRASGRTASQPAPGMAEGQGTGVLQRESARTNNNMLTENQINRFQKLASCESPQKRLMTEAVGLIEIILGVIGGLIAAEISGKMRGAVDPQWKRGKRGTPLAAVETMWRDLSASAQSRAKEGDSSLVSLLSTIESGAKKSADRLNPEQIAMIQERFGDDEELLALLAQLGEVEEEDYEAVLSQVAQHIRSRL
jgi:ribosomal protein S28E/S33